MVDKVTKKTLSNIPLMKTNAGPRDKDAWVQRLKEEYRGVQGTTWRTARPMT